MSKTLAFKCNGESYGVSIDNTKSLFYSLGSNSERKMCFAKAGSSGEKQITAVTIKCIGIVAAVIKDDPHSFAIRPFPVYGHVGIIF